MKHHASNHKPAMKGLKPHYHGKSHVPVPLPRQVEEWSAGGKYSIVTDKGDLHELQDRLHDLQHHHAWHWPGRQIMFFSDLHGDPEAFSDSLVAAGAVRRHSDDPFDVTLTRRGKRANIVIGGDCFDKGPSSLGVLRLIRKLSNQGARLRVLAGNHDVRVLFGMMVVGKKKDVHNEHFFIRTGQKILPMLKEIHDEFLTGNNRPAKLPKRATAKQALFPRKSWFDAFPAVADKAMSSAQRDRELGRIEKKFQKFEEQAAGYGMTLCDVYAAVKIWRKLFLKKDGEFCWFFKSMRLCYRSGSFLFLHAGVDDSIVKDINNRGIGPINRDFRAAIKSAPFDFYYGALCNVIRTKYRDVDLPFSKKGGKVLQQAGITAIIHGHRNLHHGQRLSFRKGVLNFECDTSLDRATRKKEHIDGRGASVTIIHPRGYILGVSSDWPKIKYFDPARTLKQLKQQDARKKQS